MFHICPDELGPLVAVYDTIGIACRWCWYKITTWRR